MERKVWDQMISTAGAVVAVVLIVLGGLAVYGGNFGQDNVGDRLEAQKVQFPPYEAMTPEEQATVGQFAGQHRLRLAAATPRVEVYCRDYERSLRRERACARQEQRRRHHRSSHDSPFHFHFTFATNTSCTMLFGPT